MNRSFLFRGRNRPPCCIVFLLIAVLVSGCAMRDHARSTLPPREDNLPIRVAVLPFQTILPDESMRTTVCPLTGAIFRGCESPNGADQILEKAFLDRFQKRYNRNLIPVEKSEGIYRRVSSDSFKVSQKEILMKIGKELDADAVIAGYLFCFRERKGYNYSVEKPASVCFGIYLYRVSDGSLLWKGLFDKSQKTLFEDILQLYSFVKEGGKWVGAEVLLNEGLDDVMKSFPELH